VTLEQCADKVDCTLSAAGGVPAQVFGSSGEAVVSWRLIATTRPSLGAVPGPAVKVDALGASCSRRL